MNDDRTTDDDAPETEIREEDRKDPAVDHTDIDAFTGVATTGHSWDGIKELNNPLPRWWLIIFYATVAWAIAYMIFMPAIPGLPGMEGATRGLRNHSERANVMADLKALDESRGPLFAKLQGADLETVESDPELLRFALAAGESAFGDNCATCHGSGAQGFVGYPNLRDDAWLWGGRLEDIKQTLLYGIRSTHPETRFSQMPAFGADGILSDAEISDLTEYVISLSGEEADAAAVTRAGDSYAINCAACHGDQGRGIQDMGAPNLTDAVWLYGSTREQIARSIYRGPYGVMPHWSGRLDEPVIDALAVYVHTLGGGVRGAPPEDASTDRPADGQPG